MPSTPGDRARHRPLGRLVDRLFRFAGISACFRVLLAPLTDYSYRFYFPKGTITGAELPVGFWLALVADVFTPLIAGLVVGHGLKGQFRYGVLRVGSAPTAPVTRPRKTSIS